MKFAMALLIGVMLGIVFAVVLALPTMVLWNALIPTIFGLPSISIWQALGLCLLTRFLFGTSTSSQKG